MNFEVDRYSSAWAHIALCADLTWASGPPDAFIVANQHLWAQHWRVSQVFQDSAAGSSRSVPNHCELADKNLVPNQENCSCSSRRSVKDVIPESRLAQFYGNFYYDDIRENCYTCTNDKLNVRGCNGHGCDNTDLTECWMLPESHQRRPARAPSPPPPSRKIRARRRQPRKMTTAPPPPAYCLDTQLYYNPTCKFQLDASRPQLTDYQRAMGRLSASVQAVMRANACRCLLYRGTNVSRYAPTGPRPVRYPDRRCNIWWPRENLSPRLENRFNTGQTQNINTNIKTEELASKNETKVKKDEPENTCRDESPAKEPERQKETLESPPQQKDEVEEHQIPSTSAALMTGDSKKRLYSTVLSTIPSPATNLNAVGCVRLSQKFTPGLIKLNSKIVLHSRLRSNDDNKFEELEKEALEQYKASDESIDTKFRELEKEAVDQYNTSNSNTSCSSGNSGEKKTAKFPPDNETQSKTKATFNKEKSVDCVDVRSQNFPDLNAKGKPNSITNLKNFHNPPNGGNRKHTHRSSKYTRNNKSASQRPASDTDYEARESNTNINKGAKRWTLHVMPPKKRHLNSFVSDCSSGEEVDDASVSIRNAGLSTKYRSTRKFKVSHCHIVHGGGDLHPILKKI